MDNNRLAAFEALLNIETNGAYSNLATGKAISRFRPDNEAFVRTLIYGVLENKLLLDYRLDEFIKSGIKKVNPRARVLLRMGLYQIDFMESVPDYAAVNETITIARKKCSGLTRFINGVLRTCLRQEGRRALPDREKNPVEYLSVGCSYNMEIAGMWVKRFGPDRAESLMRAGNEIPPLTICVNTLKISLEELAEKLIDGGFTVERPDCQGMTEKQAKSVKEHVLFVRGSGLMDTAAFQEGLFYVQDLSSIRAISELAPAPETCLIDVCSAPGGKSFLSSILMNGTGTVTSCDIYDHKLDLIRSSAQRMGIGNLQVLKKDASEFDPKLEGAADTVIADVPCSGLGVVRRRPEIKLKMTEKMIRELAEIQYGILENAARYVKKGGNLMYSTCTISELENEANTEKFLKKNENFFKIFEKQIFPDSDGSDGFYFCVMQRL